MSTEGRWFCWALVAWGVVAGCSGEPGVAGAGAPVTLEELPDAMAEAYCAGLGACCPAPGSPPTAAECDALVAPLRQALSQLDPTSVRYDPAQGARCVAALRRRVAQECSTEVSPPECRQLWSGATPAGADCAENWECADPPGGFATCTTQLDVNWEPLGSVCEQWTPGAAGEACSVTDAGPGHDLDGDPLASPRVVCNKSDGLACIGGVCTAVIEAGGPCDQWSYSVECALGLVCREVEGQWSCAAPSPVGGSCYGECFNDNGDACGCAEGLYCEGGMVGPPGGPWSSGTGACALKLPDGAPCTLSSECAGGCAPQQDGSMLCTGSAVGALCGGSGG